MKKVFTLLALMLLAIDTIAQTIIDIPCPDNNHPHAIDLGLPSGTKWACCNVGAVKPEEIGGKYAWGEVSEKSDYSWETYQFGYKDSKGEWRGEDLGNISGTQYDVAHVKWGGKWCMPTEEQIEELCKKCCVNYVILNGIKGTLITGPNSNSIFSEASICMWCDKATSTSGGLLRPNKSEMYTTGGFRYEGNNVRAVMAGTPNYKTNKDIIKENGFKPYVEPMLKTEWNQGGAENSMLPFVDSDQTERAATGCGATALAQILKYWNQPTHGIGNNYYAWQNYNKTQTIVLSADFDSSYYDWNNMISKYTDNKNVTSKQVDAIAKLMYDIAVALEMKLSYSTGTQIEYIHTALKKYFGYNPNMQLLRQINHAYTVEEWLKIIYNELSNGRPILMGGTWRGVNHIFVADGYDEEGLVHLNLGHAYNEENIYYDLSEYGQTYSENMRMIIGICPQELQTSVTSVKVSAPGKLVDDLGGLRNAQRVTRLKVNGTINSEDISLLSKLTQTTTGQLSYIDLSNCTIESGILPSVAFCTGNEYNFTLQQIILPKELKEIGNQAFFRCRGLYEVTLPNTLGKIGDKAFGDCRYLTELSIPKSVSQIGTNPFIYDKMDKLTIKKGNAYFVMKNDALLSKDGSSFISLPLKPHDDYVIPEGVRDVYDSSISEGFRLRNLYFPTTIQTISYNAFVGYTALENMYFYSVNAPMAPTSSNILQCVIHVPRGYKNEYANKGWDKFAAIVDDCDIQPTKVEGMPTSDKDEENYYSLQGIKVKQPSKGIYIKNGKKIIIK